MRSRLNLLAIALFVLVAPAFAAEPESRPGELLVKYRDGVNSSAKLSGLRGMSARAMGGETRVHKLQVSAGQDPEAALRALRADPDVLYAEPNYIYRASLLPNDPGITTNRQWGLKNSGAAMVALSPFTALHPAYDSGVAGVANKDMGLANAWAVTTDCSAVIVAVVDTGVNYNHPDLFANMWDESGVGTGPFGRDYITTAGDPNSSTNPMDRNGHGTHVAGAIGARGNNGLGMTGVCWKVKIMGMRALDQYGSGSLADVALAIRGSVDLGAKIINLSLGGPASSTLRDAIQYARDHDVLVVAAAGNSANNNDSSPTYPCSYTSISNVLCVGAVDNRYQLADFSNYGVNTVHVAAPGVDIWSTWLGLEEGPVSSSTTPFSSGTSGSGFAFTQGYVPTGLDLAGYFYDMLYAASNWNGTSTTYAVSTDYRVYKAFNLASKDIVDLFFSYYVDTGSGDTFHLGYNPSGGDPFAGGGTTVNLSGNHGTSSSDYARDFTDCRTATCSVGFRLNSDASGVGRGAAVVGMSFRSVVWDTSGTGATSAALGNGTYALLSGTSMATPMVAGLAALLKAHQPAYTAYDLKAAIMNSVTTESSLSGLIGTGGVANAERAIATIVPPTGVSAVPQ